MATHMYSGNVFCYFQGPPMSCIRLAERVVALICCEKLHKIGKSIWKAHAHNKVENIVRQKHVKDLIVLWGFCSVLTLLLSLGGGEDGWRSDVTWRSSDGPASWWPQLAADGCAVFVPLPDSLSIQRSLLVTAELWTLVFQWVSLSN